MHKRAGAVLALLLAIFGVVFGAASSATAAEDGPALRGVITDATNKPIAGVKISVTGDGFKGESTTAANGTWVVKLPKSGTYTASLDEATLPSGVTLTDPSASTRQVSVFSSPKTILFPIGAAETASSDKAGRAVQLVADGLIFGLVLALGAVGLSLIYGTTGLTNFAHGELITLGAISTYLLNVVVGLHFLIAAPLALLVCGALGGLQDRALWRPLRKRGTGLIAMLVVSIGLGIFLRYVILFFFGGSTKQFAQYAAQPGLDLGPVTLTPSALTGAAVAVALLLGTAWWLLKTRMGKASRAVADNPALASASGIDVERVINVVWILGALLAAMGGILYSLANGINWLMGFQLLLLVFAGVTLGGLGTAFGALVGSLLVGVLIQVSTLFIPTELKNVGALAILIVVLLLRPQGLLGRAERVG